MLGRAVRVFVCFFEEDYNAAAFEVDRRNGGFGEGVEKGGYFFAFYVFAA